MFNIPFFLIVDFSSSEEEGTTSSDIRMFLPSGHAGVRLSQTSISAASTSAAYTSAAYTSAAYTSAASTSAASTSAASTSTSSTSTALLPEVVHLEQSTMEGSDATSLSNKVKTLSEIFPMLDEAEIRSLLQANHMGVQETINAIPGVSGTLSHFSFSGSFSIILLKSITNCFE